MDCRATAVRLKQLNWADPIATQMGEFPTDSVIAQLPFSKTVFLPHQEFCLLRAVKSRQGVLGLAVKDPPLPVERTVIMTAASGAATRKGQRQSLCQAPTKMFKSLALCSLQNPISEFRSKALQSVSARDE